MRVLDSVIGSLRPGVFGSEVAAIGTKSLGRLTDDIFYHYTFGYPVGIGFPPSWLEWSGFLLIKGNHSPIEAGMVFHIPVSLRRYGKYGIGLSQTVLITEGGAEILTQHIPREIQIAG
jgi:Xaa-Pro dipeptidase